VASGCVALTAQDSANRAGQVAVVELDLGVRGEDLAAVGILALRHTEVVQHLLFAEAVLVASFFNADALLALVAQQIVR
jgi:hypothetical protein